MPKRGKTPRKSKPRLRTQICKPCWELKYCPYGPLVEHFPLGPDTHSFNEIDEQYRGLLTDFAEGRFKTEEAILEAIDSLEFHWPGRWQFIQQFRSRELQCNVFGHICPVFFTWEWATETKTGRRHSRTIPRDVMLKVVRRDDGVCQICFKLVPDDEVQFDHVIPHSRGGQASTDNIRLVHRSCNARRRDSLADLLER